ncbi:SPFH domain-containing protein [Leeia sp. TBRC 13508]|uniref:SPFH domain-containing protein n=1 Tax=Leeia speluncae TaxID=2884804 RepID=A0ABS8DAF1_9NEIS|nr:SPFH domain-containing protein [Leeia speluncae]MCB6185184.1 SPFH domain-containing protein [Leeia speluncae]
MNPIVIGLLGIILFVIISGIRIVEQQTVSIVQTLGRYSRTLAPGLNWIFIPFQQIAGKLSLKIESVPATVEVKTLDNMFVALPVNLMIQVEPERAADAFYKLQEPHEQVRAWVLNTVRSVAASMTLEDMFKDREKIVGEVRHMLTTKLSEFGYLLEGVLIDQPTVSLEVQSSFNRVVAATREKEAAQQEAEAAMIRTVKQAEAEAEAQRQRAKGLADSRKLLAEGLKESLLEFSGVPPHEAISILLETNRIDALREIGKHGNLVVLDLQKTDEQTAALMPLLSSLKKKAATPAASLTKPNQPTSDHQNSAE